MERFQIEQTEISGEFIEGMKARMVISFYKYGPVADAYPHKVDAIGSLMQRLREYAETGNTEWLMDVANFAMIEFMYPRHPDAHFEGTDDDASPGRISRKNALPDKRDNKTIGSPKVSRLSEFR